MNCTGASVILEPSSNGDATVSSGIQGSSERLRQRRRHSSHHPKPWQEEYDRIQQLVSESKAIKGQIESLINIL